jgi:hypothetical protein
MRLMKIFFLLLTQLEDLNAELNPICHLLALVGAHYILHVSRVRVNVVQLKIDQPVYNTKQ